MVAARDSPLTNTVRQTLHDISSAERWTSRDHDLSMTSGRRSALTNLELVRTDHAVFFPPCSGFNVPISNGRRSDREKYIVYSCSLLVHKQLSLCASDSLIPKFLRVTLPSTEHESICPCMVWCNLKHICRSSEVFLSTRLLGWCLKHWIDDAMVTVDFDMLF